jgi:nucleotidyltransferase substrate binding protein (TIGR01987 family)
MSAEDIRWVQRCQHFKQAFEQLRRAQVLAGQRPLTELEEQGMIQAFEYTHELAWNTLKDFLESKGFRDLYGSKDTTREAFKQDLIEDGDVWMDMIRSRNLSSHTYNLETAKTIVKAIREKYFGAFEKVLAKLTAMNHGKTE